MKTFKELTQHLENILEASDIERVMGHNIDIKSGKHDSPRIMKPHEIPDGYQKEPETGLVKRIKDTNADRKSTIKAMGYDQDRYQGD